MIKVENKNLAKYIIFGGAALIFGCLGLGLILGDNPIITLVFGSGWIVLAIMTFVYFSNFSKSKG